MSTPIDSPAEEALTELARRFAHWRQSRTHGRARIPEDLWDQAVALSTVLSNARVAKRLPLQSDRSQKTARCPTGSISDCGRRDTPRVCRHHAVNAMADGLTGRDTGRIRAAGWGTDGHPLARVGTPVGGLGADVSGGALMLQLTPQSRIFLAVEPVDFRCGIDRLAAFCRQRLE
jgi:hypothetical protein